MNTKQLRQLFKKIYDKQGKKIMPKTELLHRLEEAGLTSEQAIHAYNEAARQKIIRSGLGIQRNPKTGETEETIVAEYMTEEDWEAERALDQAEEEIWKIRKQLHPEEY